MTPKLDQAVVATALAVHKTKAQWLDQQMQRIMPPEIYALSKKDKGSARFKLARWVSANKVEVMEHPTVNDPPQNLSPLGEVPEMPTGSISITDLRRGDDIVSRFSIRFKDGKIETQTKDWPV